MATIWTQSLCAKRTQLIARNMIVGAKSVCLAIKVLIYITMNVFNVT